MDQPLANFDACPEYRPGGMTALHDCLGMVIDNKLKSERSENVTMVIITDGQENASKEYTHQQIKDLITEAEENHNWNVSYIGANVCVESEARRRQRHRILAKITPPFPV